MKSIVVKPQALVNMILSATETYKQEALGIVFGKRIKNRVVIENALPYQTTKRCFSGVEQTNKSVVLDIFLESFDTVVGDYHTHTDFKRATVPTHMSETDKKDLQEGKVGFVIGIKKNKKRAKESFGKGSGKGIAIAIQNYRYSVRCYYKNNHGKITELDIQCFNPGRIFPSSNEIGKFINNRHSLWEYKPRGC